MFMVGGLGNVVCGNDSLVARLLSRSCPSGRIFAATRSTVTLPWFNSKNPLSCDAV